eukprot:908329-Pyramimonas_sp.AAC.1
MEASAFAAQALPAQDPGSLLCFATLNPGRTGFLALGTGALLDWRPEAVGHALVACGVDICVLSGARFPPGARLPPGYPCMWLGGRSTEWGAVGIFVRAELSCTLRPVADLSGPRSQWFAIWNDSASDVTPVLEVRARYPSSLYV